MNNPKMILPDFVRLSYIFDELCELRRERPEVFEDYSIYGVHGLIDELNWHEKSRMSGNTSVIRHGVHFGNERNVFARRKYYIFLDFSNPLINERDCFDRYGEKALKDFENNNNAVVLSSETLLNRVKNDFSQYLVCWKFFEKISTDEVVEILDRVDLALIPTTFARDAEFINVIPANLRTRCIFVTNDMCSHTCPKFSEHLEKSIKIAHDIEGEDFNEFCPIFYGKMTDDGETTYLDRLSNYEIQNVLYPLGYETFYVDSSSLSPYHFIYELVTTIVKKEYQMDVFELLIDVFHIRQEIFMQQYRAWK